MDTVPYKDNYRRTEGQLAMDREYVSRLLARGYKITEIAEIVQEERPGYKYSYGMATGDVNAVKQLWLESSLIEFHTAKAQQLAKIDEVEHQYWIGWFESRKDVDKTVVEEKTGHQSTTRGERAAEYKHTKVKRDKANQFGDPRFLDGVRNCIEMRIQIFGLKVPERLEVDWRAEAAKFGFTTEASNQMMNNLVEEFVAAAAKGIEEQADDSAAPGDFGDTERGT